MKKLLSLLLAAIIVITVPASTAFANDNIVSINTKYGTRLEFHREEQALYLHSKGLLVISPVDFEHLFRLNNIKTSSVKRLVLCEGITITDMAVFSEGSGEAETTDLKDNISELVLPKSLKRIVFTPYTKAQYKKLKTIGYGGTEKEWQSIKKDGEFTNLEIRFSRDIPQSKDYVYKPELHAETVTKALPKTDISVTLNYITGEISLSGKGIAKADFTVNTPNGTVRANYVTDLFHCASKYNYIYSSLEPYNYVKKLILSEGITELGRYAFASLTRLERVDLPKSLKAIADDCFNIYKLSKEEEKHIGGYSSIKYNIVDVYYSGNASSWKGIKIGRYNEFVTSGRMHYLGPADIKNLKMSSNAPKSITLSWSKSSNASYYTIDKYNASTKKWIRVATTTKTSCKVAATEGCKYKFRVRAYRNVNDGNKLCSAYTYLEAASKPKGTSVKSLSAGKGKLTVKWSKQAERTTGYQIEYSTSKDFRKSTKINISNPNTTSRTIKGLKSGKRYYVRVRTYKTVKLNGKSQNIYSYRGTVKSAKVK